MHVNDCLNDSNYADWSREMKYFLVAKNRVGFIDGTIPKPAEDVPEYRPWQRSDAIIKGWITTAMEKEIRNSVKYGTTARQIWEDLEERFGKQSAPRAYELKPTLTTMRQERLSVSSYFTMMRGVSDEIEAVSPLPTCTCGNCSCNLGKKLAESKEKERIYEFLMGLDDSFGNIKTQILSTKPMPSLGTVYHLVAEDEQQKNISASRKPIVEAAAYQTRAQQNRDGNFYDKRTNRETLKCKHCGKTGHTVEGCFEKIGYPDWWETRQKKTTNEQRRIAKPKPKAAAVGIETSPIPGLTIEYRPIQEVVTTYSWATHKNLRSTWLDLHSEEADWHGEM